MNLLNLDGNVIYNAPCLEEMASMPDKCIDHTITDPPYSHHVHTNQTRFTESNRLANGSNTYKYELGFSCLTSESRVEYALQFARLTKRWILVFCDAESIGDWKRALEYAGSIYKRTCAWIKPTAQPQLSGDRPAQGFEPIACAYGSPGRSVWNAGGKVGLYYSLVPRSEERFHPTEKPVDLMEQIIKDFTSPNDLILDPFSGSGSTHVAAKKWMRKSIGFEVDESYSSKANARILRTECVLDDPSSLVPRNGVARQVSLFSDSAQSPQGLSGGSGFCDRTQAGESSASSC